MSTLYDIDGNVIKIGLTASDKMPLLPIFGETTIIKHQGGNSANALRLAYNNGYKAVEGDVRFTSDNVPIMCHNSTIGGLNIDTSTLAELQAVDTVYTLDEWLTDCKKYNILAEIDFTKTYTQAQCETLVQHIKANSMTNRCTVECYIDSSMGYLSQYSPDLVLSVLGCRSTSIIDSLASIEDYCRAIICVIPHDDASKSLVSYAHSKGYLSRIWTASSTDTLPDVEVYLDMCADFVLTDNVKPSDIMP